MTKSPLCEARLPGRSIGWPVPKPGVFQGCVVIFALVFTSCTDLSEVTKFADSSQKVGSSFAEMAGEAHLGCIAANKFVSDKNPVTPLDCNWYVSINPSLIAVNTALFAYIASLGKLASSDTSKVGSELDHVSDDLKKGDPKISAASLAQASSAGGFAKAIAEVWASGYRERSLSGIIQRNDERVKSVTEFLSEYAVDAFRQTLSDERKYEVSYCDLMRSAQREPLATVLLEKTCAGDEDLLDRKLNAIAAYRQSLAIISTTHAKFANETGKWDVKALSKDLATSMGDLVKAASTVNKAF